MTCWLREPDDNFTSHIYLMFEILHLECVLKTSKTEAVVKHEGFFFDLAFASYKVFKETLTTGTYFTYKKALDANRVRQQN